MGNSGPVRCDSGHGGHATKSPADAYPKAFPEISKQVPLTPKMDDELGFHKYEWGYEAVPMSQARGGRTYEEVTDAKSHQTATYPFPMDQRAFHAGKPGEDRINTQYDNMLADTTSLAAKGKAYFSSNWERALAYHTGVFVPETMKEAKSADDIRVAVSEFSDKVQQDAPKDACKYLQIEEYRCLQTYQFEANPQQATQKCVKWWDEWSKCQWDQAKFNAGTTYIEGPAMRRRRPYIFYPDFKYA